MRPLRVTLGIVVLSLAIFPARADAYFWAWLDELSGPKFVGFVAEWRVYCKAESAANEREALLKLHGILEKERKKYWDAANPKNQAAKRYFDNAVHYSMIALELVKRAIEELEKDSTNDVSRLVLVALVWRGHADDHYEWGKKLEQGERVDETKAPREPPVPDVNEAMVRNLVVGGGISFSLCDAKPLHRDKRYLNVAIGWGYDIKDDNRGQGNRLVLFGASYHGVVTPYLTVGTGAGLATFSSSNQEPAHRLYVQPWIVDFRPGGLRRNAQFHGPWWHVFFLRYSTIIFPAGFEPGQFGGVSPRYRAELVHSLGFHADMAPLIRGFQKRW